MAYIGVVLIAPDIPIKQVGCQSFRGLKPHFFVSVAPHISTPYVSMVGGIEAIFDQTPS